MRRKDDVGFIGVSAADTMERRRAGDQPKGNVGDFKEALDQKIRRIGDPHLREVLLDFLHGAGPVSRDETETVVF